MSTKKKVFKIFIFTTCTLLLLLVSAVIHYIYLDTFYHVRINNTLLASKDRLSYEVAQIAITNDNPGECENIRVFLGGALDLLGPSERQIKDHCYVEIANTLNDTSICLKVTDTERRHCATPLAIFNNDIRICNIIDRMYDRSGCYSELTKLGTPASACNDLPDSESDDCNVNAAEFSKDVSICTKVYTDIKRANCYFLATNSKVFNDSMCTGLKGIDFDLCNKTIRSESLQVFISDN